MSTRSTALPLAVLTSLAILVSACGGGAVATDAIATQAPISQAPAATDGGLPSFDTSSFHADEKLEDLFPDSIGGEELNVLSMSGDQFMGEGASPELVDALGALGKEASDLSVAFGANGSVVIIAFRLDGVSGQALLTALFQAVQQENGSTVTDVSISGKSIKKLVSTDTEETLYIYAASDVVFSVVGDGISNAQLDEIFSKLP